MKTGILCPKGCGVIVKNNNRKLQLHYIHYCEVTREEIREAKEKFRESSALLRTRNETQGCYVLLDLPCDSSNMVGTYH